MTMSISRREGCYRMQNDSVKRRGHDDGEEVKKGKKSKKTGYKR